MGLLADVAAQAGEQNASRADGVQVVRRALLSELRLPIVVLREDTVDGSRMVDVSKHALELQLLVEAYLTEREALRRDAQQLRSNLKRRGSMVAGQIPAGTHTTAVVMRRALAEKACRLSLRLASLLHAFGRASAWFEGLCKVTSTVDVSDALAAKAANIAHLLRTDVVPVSLEGSVVSLGRADLAVVENLQSGDVVRAQALVHGAQWGGLGGEKGARGVRWAG